MMRRPPAPASVVAPRHPRVAKLSVADIVQVESPEELEGALIRLIGAHAGSDERERDVVDRGSFRHAVGFWKTQLVESTPSMLTWPAAGAVHPRGSPSACSSPTRMHRSARRCAPA